MIQIRPLLLTAIFLLNPVPSNAKCWIDLNKNGQNTYNLKVELDNFGILFAETPLQKLDADFGIKFQKIYSPNIGNDQFGNVLQGVQIYAEFYKDGNKVAETNNVEEIYPGMIWKLADEILVILHKLECDFK